MRTFDKMHSDLNRDGWSCCYWGEHGDWLVAMGRHRDSDIMTNSNWDVFIEMLDKIDTEEDVYRIESESHWAVGWVEHILINPANPTAVALAEEVQASLEDSSILDETHFSNCEYESFLEDWNNWGASEFRSECVKQFGLCWGARCRLDEIDNDTLRDWFAEHNRGGVTNIQFERFVDDYMDRNDMAVVLKLARVPVTGDDSPAE